MKTIDILIQEHEEISLFVTRLEQECLALMQGKEVEENFFRAAIDFIREFADGNHHKKEEDILFDYMLNHLGPLAEKTVRHGMLVEHQMARYHVMMMENCLNSYLQQPDDLTKLHLLGEAMSYVNLLRSHIDKENNAVYPFAEKNLSLELAEEIDEKTVQRCQEEESKATKKQELLQQLQITA